MSKFTSDLNVTPLGNRKWRINSEFEYHVGCYPSKEIITIPVNFITDFASIPRIFWFIIDPIGQHGKAAVVHDYCYATAIYSKKRSDEIFLEAMEVLKVKKWKRKVMYYSVVCFGRWSWDYRRDISI